MPIFNLDEFMGRVGARGMARPNRFEVVIAPPAGLAGQYEMRLINIMAEIFVFPPMTHETSSVRHYGPAEHRPINPEYGGAQGAAMTLLVETDFRVKEFFDQWMHRITPPGLFSSNYSDFYTTIIGVFQHDQENNITYRTRLFDAWPKYIGPMTVNNSDRNNVHRMDVVFSYRYWDSTSLTGGQSIDHGEITGAGIDRSGEGLSGSVGGIFDPAGTAAAAAFAGVDDFTF